MVTKVKIKGARPELNEEASAYARQKPNRKFLLAIYNTFNTEKGQYKPPSRIKAGIGEEPVIYDTTLTEISTKQINAFLKDKGYFDSKANYVTEIKKKRAYITYNIEPNTPYRIASLNYDIADTGLRRLFAENSRSDLIHVGQIYQASTLDDEQGRLNQLFRSAGYFKFTKQYIRFLVIDTTKNFKVRITEIVDNPDSGKHEKFFMDSITVRIHADVNSLNLVKSGDTSRLLKRSILWKDPYARFRPLITRNTIYLEKGRLFSVNDQLITYKRLAELNVFREIRITYIENHRDSLAKLNALIDVTERKKLNASLGLEGNFNGSYYGLTPTITYTDRNFFRGAEVFQLKLGGAFNNTIRKSDLNVYDRREFSAQASLTYPFLVLPFYSSRMGREGDLPHTTITTRYSYVYQPLYTRSEVGATLSYEFDDTKSRIHTITPIEATFLKAKLDPIFDSIFVVNGNESRLQSFTSSIISGSAYNFTLNAYLLKAHANFSYVNANIEVVGNSLALADHLLSSKATRDNGQIFGLPIYQYVKPEIDFRWYRKVGPNGEFIFRLDPGVAYAYGKTNSLKSTVPFDRQFYVGGPNSIRAWLDRQLGPGSYIYKIPPGITDPTQLSQQIQIRAIDQTGEVKLQGNMEYRFNITSQFFAHHLSGATFIDYGNIWTLRPDPTRPGSNFEFNTFLKQIAIGTGAGLRYDLSFFIFRFDVGLKLYDPIFSNTDGWVIKHFGSKEFSDYYIQQFGDDHTGGYRFITYNFGIGFPF